MLHEMRPGEMGSMVVSTPVLARYKIGDLIRAFEPLCFRCIGRDKWLTPLRYAWGEFRTFNLVRLWVKGESPPTRWSFQIKQSPYQFVVGALFRGCERNTEGTKIRGKQGQRVRYEAQFEGQTQV